MAVRPVGAGGLRCLASLFTLVGVACGGDEDPSPGMIVRAAAHARDLAGLAIRVEVGDADPLADEARWLASRLDSLGAVHELEVFEGDHVAGVRDRFEGSVFQFFSSVLRAPGGWMP